MTSSESLAFVPLPVVGVKLLPWMTATAFWVVAFAAVAPMPTAPLAKALMDGAFPAAMTILLLPPVVLILAIQVVTDVQSDPSQLRPKLSLSPGLRRSMAGLRLVGV